jgi:predicted Zn-dependent protease
VAKGSDALSAAEAGNYAQARAEIADARSINPLSVDLLFQQAAIENAGDNPEGAQAALQEAVRKQPANPAPWEALAEFELSQGRKPQALSAVGSALYLDPRSQTAIATYLEASREN